MRSADREEIRSLREQLEQAEEDLLTLNDVAEALGIDDEREDAPDLVEACRAIRARAEAAEAALTAQREELEAIRRIGAQMANLCYNLFGRAGLNGERHLTARHLEVMRDLRQEWDAIPRSEPITGSTKEGSQE